MTMFFEKSNYGVIKMVNRENIMETEDVKNRGSHFGPKELDHYFHAMERHKFGHKF